MSDPDSVGYKRPPKSTQFRPHQSGNPGGRPKKVASLREDLEAELSQQVTHKEGGRELQITKQQAFVKALVAAAIGGDARAGGALIGLARTSQSTTSAPSAADLALLEEFINREIDRRAAENNK